MWLQSPRFRRDVTQRSPLPTSPPLFGVPFKSSPPPVCPIAFAPHVTLQAQLPTIPQTQRLAEVKEATERAGCPALVQAAGMGRYEVLALLRREAGGGSKPLGPWGGAPTP